MHKGSIYSFVFLYFICLCKPGITQNEENFTTFSMLEDDISDYIPPLTALIDSAIIHSPLLKAQDAQIYINKYEIKTAKREWTRNLGLETNIKYGSYDNLQVSQYSEDPENPSAFLATNTQTRFSTGIYVKFPFFYLYDRRNQVKIAQEELTQARFDKERMIYELRQLVIQVYNQMLLAQNLVKIHNENSISTDLQVQMAEKMFTNGQLPVSELARLKDIHTRSLINLEQSKSEFQNSFMILEEIVGIKFSLIKSEDN